MRGSWDEGRGSRGVQLKPDALLTKEMWEEQFGWNLHILSPPGLVQKTENSENFKLKLGFQG